MNNAAYKVEIELFLTKTESLKAEIHSLRTENNILKAEKDQLLSEIEHLKSVNEQMRARLRESGRTLLLRGMDAAEVARLTGLSPDELKA